MRYIHTSHGVVKSGSDWSAAKHWVMHTCTSEPFANAMQTLTKMSEETFTLCPRSTNDSSKIFFLLTVDMHSLHCIVLTKLLYYAMFATSKNTQTVFSSCNTSIGRQKQLKKKT